MYGDVVAQGRVLVSLDLIIFIIDSVMGPIKTPVRSFTLTLLASALGGVYKAIPSTTKISENPPEGPLKPFKLARIVAGGGTRRER